MHKPARHSGTLFWLWLISAFAVAAPAMPAAVPDGSPVKRIVVLGDSLSEGYQLKSSEAWPLLIAGKLKTAHLEFEMNNASQAGRTTTQGLAELTPLVKRNIDIFILELGVNDAFRRVSVPEIRANLQTIIDRVRQKDPSVQIIIAGMQLPDSTPDGYFRHFGEMYVDLASNNHATLLPYLLSGVAGNPSLTLSDHFHPNAAGQKIIAEHIWKVLEPIVQQVAGERSASASAQWRLVKRRDELVSSHYIHEEDKKWDETSFGAVAQMLLL